MSTFVVPLNAVRRADVQQVGTKAATLGTLLDAGFPVPPGFCVTAQAFRLALDPLIDPIHTVLSGHELSSPAGAEAAAQAIARLTAKLSIPAVIREALGCVLASSENAPTAWAVRSSATAEDRPDASFAGQYVSVIGVRTQDELLQAILACWRSFFAASALAARAAHSALDRGQAMAVLIQPAIEAECAGVCFSIDPVRRRRDVAVVHAVWGLGIGVVNGSVATDTAWVHRTEFVVDDLKVVGQGEQIVLDLVYGVRRAPVPAGRRRSACLPDPWLKRVCQLGVASEVLLGCPQDVEWAVAGERVWVLQSRPITALPSELAARPFPVAWNAEQDRRRHWTLLDLSGREGEALLPLEIDYETVKESVRAETCLFMGADRNQEIQVYNGRIYYASLPFPLPESERLMRRAAYQELKRHLWDQGITAWDHWGPEIVRANERLRSFAADGADGPHLAEHLEETLAVRRRFTMLHPSMWFKPEQPFFDAYARVAGRSGQDAEDAAYGLLDGGETPFADLVDSVHELARMARTLPAVAELIADPPANVIERLQALPEAALFCAELGRLMSRYGERSGRGYGFEPTILTPTWREDPSQVLALVTAYLAADTEPLVAIRARTRRARDMQVETICAACADREAIAEFRSQLARARKTMAVLEYHNHYVDQMGFGHVRHAVTAAAQWLVAAGVLSAQEDVFWLTFAEIGVALREGAGASLQTTIATRREAYARWAALEAPPLLGVPEATLSPRPPPQDDVTVPGASSTGLVTGQGASPGRVSGRARVVEASMALPDLSPGEVLVARNISPRWAPLLAVACAVVIDEGSPGQHAAITAREYGVPAVIHTVVGTRRIPDGAWVTVDGKAGTVEIVLTLDNVQAGTAGL